MTIKTFVMPFKVLKTFYDNAFKKTDRRDFFLFVQVLQNKCYISHTAIFSHKCNCNNKQVIEI